MPLTVAARDVYYDIHSNTIGELMKPHLVIYLDVPVSVIQKRIKERNVPHEVNSKVFKQQYLSDIEYFYKQRYLKEIGLVKTVSSCFHYISCCQIQNLEMCLLQEIFLLCL
jgi:deoxyadenosine/deoxycytidine kinase